MKELQCDREHILECKKRCICALRVFILRVHTRLYHLYVPVAELVPYKVIYLANGYSELILLHIVGYILYQGVDYGNNSLILCMEVARLRIMQVEAIEIHLDESGGIPDLICEVSRILYLGPVESHIIARSIACHEGKPQGICAVLVDDIERIDTIAKGLAHLAALVITHKSVDQHMMERNLTCLLDSREYHSDDPEEDDIISCHEDICRIEILEVLCLLRPAECLERPEC